MFMHLHVDYFLLSEILLILPNLFLKSLKYNIEQRHFPKKSKFKTETWSSQVFEWFNYFIEL